MSCFAATSVNPDALVLVSKSTLILESSMSHLGNLLICCVGVGLDVYMDIRVVGGNAFWEI
jgi:hypothetical protein